MRFLPLVAATYFMVSGGPYGIEDILGGAGFAKAIVILLVLPFMWCLPTALMIGELASAIPAEGGFYIWVRRALGPFWGYQEGWLSLSASIFDMAIYPAIFVLYLGKFSPALTARLERLRLVAGGGGALLRVEPARSAGGGRGLGVDVRSCCWRRLRSLWFSASGMGLTLHPAVQWSGPATASAQGRLFRPRSWWPCGITWAGTTPPLWRGRWRIRSATIPAP